MARFLVVTTLVVAQFMTWAGGSLYMCVACDGSVGIDLGPGACHRCHGEQRAAGEHRHEHDCGCCRANETAKHERALQPPADDRSEAGRPCDCQHQLIASEQSSAAWRQSQVERALEHLLHGSVAVVALPAPLTHVQQIERPLFVATTVEHSPQLAALSATVLRC